MSVGLNWHRKLYTIFNKTHTPHWFCHWENVVSSLSFESLSTGITLTWFFIQILTNLGSVKKWEETHCKGRLSKSGKGSGKNKLEFMMFSLHFPLFKRFPSYLIRKGGSVSTGCTLRGALLGSRLTNCAFFVIQTSC